MEQILISKQPSFYETQCNPYTCTNREGVTHRRVGFNGKWFCEGQQMLDDTTGRSSWSPQRCHMLKKGLRCIKSRGHKWGCKREKNNWLILGHNGQGELVLRNLQGAIRRVSLREQDIPFVMNHQQPVVTVMGGRVYMYGLKWMGYSSVAMVQKAMKLPLDAIPVTLAKKIVVDYTNQNPEDPESYGRRFFTDESE